MTGALDNAMFSTRVLFVFQSHSLPGQQGFEGLVRRLQRFHKP